MNESTGTHKDEVARAGDLMSSLPEGMRADNMMSYIGHEGTYTPSHSEMCSALGHNIMVETSTGTVEDGKLTKPGSSIWFMTETKDRHLVSEYWRSTLGHDIEIEDHFAQVNAWKSAPFKTYIVEQRVGDFILIPPLAAHQVWNRGTRTMKVAWNRTTAETLEMALNESLPKARMVCRDEQYKNKALVYFTLRKYSALLNASTGRSPQLRALRKDFKLLFSLYSRILLSESFSRNLPEPRKIESLPFAGNVTCSYCRCNIFNRFLTCPSCVGKMPDGDDDTYDICMECYAIGRSCACISKLKWVEQFRWKELIHQHETWRNQITQFPSSSNDSAVFQPLVMEQERLGKKTLAEVCQEELKRRPWTDITKPGAPDVDPADNIDDDGERTQKRRKTRKSDHRGRCHICKGAHPSWKIATCGHCNLVYCYVSLFKAFDMLPISISENITWKCPRCSGICPCGACRRDPAMKPVAPTSTRLGHDTKKIADPRSVESLFDSSHSNLIWLKKFGDHPEDNQDSQRMRQRMEEAARAKLTDPVLDDHDETDGPESGQPPTTFIDQLPPLIVENHQETAGDNAPPIDPALMSMPPQEPQVGFVVPKNGVLRENLPDRYQVTEAITFEFPPEEQTPSQSNPPVEPLNQQVQVVNDGLSLDVDETNNGREAVIVQSDINAANMKGRRGFKRKNIPPPDDDFTPDRRVYNRSRPNNRNIITRRQQQRPLYNEANASDTDRDDTHNTQNKAPEQQPHGLPASGSDQREVSDEISNDSGVSLPEQRISAPSRSSSRESSIPLEMTQSEKNKRAKLRALEWAEGHVDDFDVDGF